MKKLNVLVPSVLALFVASAAHAGATFDTPQGKLNIGGDVEYDLTAQNFGDTNVGNTAGESVSDVQKASGRIIFDVNGERVLSNGNFAGFKINPAFGTNGDYLSGEDSWFSFGVKNDWAFKMGHYEAYDLSPAGQDTYVVGYGDNLYRAKAARGRASSGSQVMFSKEAGQWHMEVSTLFGDDNGMYDNMAGVEKNKDPLVARPVVAWTGDTVTVAVGAEINLIPDAYVTN
ncbi:MAG: carbohydrate porin, partial [Tolumonas sp.]